MSATTVAVPPRKKPAVAVHAARRSPSTPDGKAKAKTARARQALPVGEDRRAHILAAAQRVFESKGLEGANMRAIAREAHYTVGALYFYYKSREEIYADLLTMSSVAVEGFHARGGPGRADARRADANAGDGVLRLLRDAPR